MKYRILQDTMGIFYLQKFDYHPNKEQEQLEQQWLMLAKHNDRDHVKKILAEIKNGQRDSNGFKLVEECDIEVNYEKVV